MSELHDSYLELSMERELHRDIQKPYEETVDPYYSCQFLVSAIEYFTEFITKMT